MVEPNLAPVDGVRGSRALRYVVIVLLLSLVRRSSGRRALGAQQR
jgi:hypothetical protein